MCFLIHKFIHRSETQKFKTLQVNIPNSTSEGNKQLNDKDICIPMDIGGSPSPNRSLRNDISPSQKLVKRSSVDSGINMTSVQSSDSLPSLKPRNRNNGKENPKLSRSSLFKKVHKAYILFSKQNFLNIYINYTQV